MKLLILLLLLLLAGGGAATWIAHNTENNSTYKDYSTYVSKDVDNRSQVVPEPITCVMVGLGAVVVMMRRKR